MHEAGNNFKHLFFLSIEYKPYMNCIYWSQIHKSQLIAKWNSSRK
jgi:hypothetical protein